MNSEIIQMIEDAIAAEKSGFPAGDARELRKVITMQNQMMNEQTQNIMRMSELFTTSMKKVTEMIDKNNHK